MADSPTPPPLTRAGTPTGEPQQPKAVPTLSKVVELSVFDVLNIFCHRWFLSRTALLAQVISAQKAEDSNISWVEFSPPFHSHLVKCAVALVPRLGCPVPMVKRVMFVFILELLNWEGHLVLRFSSGLLQTARLPVMTTARIASLVMDPYLVALYHMYNNDSFLGSL